ncbi:Trans-1,2-dihydrobenzene-1,2-diol dehydrogenase [Choanephora cucurbitarum]|uniref:D-xylose 1-dehydrogenase (NADP(+), D-xylono-1,5-lactone-forming) n=1 Tax=Choanephora cucurbitarum TaxID=101091 RepID=A0A1C7NN06_9FUNG|nr:Trans-1,2-dihydrobenzene-1,2-diol dehydrogenase [Choanephora cucurbitarum]
MLKWGILGTGSIAHTFAKSLEITDKGQLVAVGSRSLKTAKKFAESFQVPYSFGSYEALLANDQVDIVYIATPHPQHYELALLAARSGKHMLIEKPMAMCTQQVETILKTAKECNVFVMEAYMYKCHPQTKQLVDMIHSGAIGQVKVIRAQFSFDGRSLGPSSRLWLNQLGGGAILDIGGYPMSFARLVAGTNPIKIKATGHVQPETQVDEWSNACLEFEGHITAQLFAGIFADADSSVEVLGSEGVLKVDNLWRPDLTQLGPVQIEWTTYGKSMQVVPVVLEQTDLYVYEIESVTKAILEGKLECHDMSWEDSLGQVRAMDAWRHEIGLYYAEDKKA